MRLSLDLSKRSGRGFSERNLEQMRAFYLGCPISQAASAKTLRSPNAERESHISQTVSAKLTGERSWPVHSPFPLPWSHYARLLAVRNSQARAFYESEAFRGGWTIRQLDRQIQSQFYERTALACDKAAMLRKGTRSHTSDAVTPDEEIKNPYVLEFLGLPGQPGKKAAHARAEYRSAFVTSAQTSTRLWPCKYTVIGLGDYCI